MARLALGGSRTFQGGGLGGPAAAAAAAAAAAVAAAAAALFLPLPGSPAEGALPSRPKGEPRLWSVTLVFHRGQAAAAKMGPPAN